VNEGPGNDAELLARYVQGDAGAFESLVARHASMVYRTCLRLLGDAHDAEDSAQAVFVVLARKAARFRGGGDLSAWLHGIARRVASEARRSAARRRRREEEGAMIRNAASGGTLSAEERSAALRELDRELARLPGKQRQAVVLRYLEGRGPQEAARLAGCPERTLGWRAKDGLERLRSRLAGRGVELGAGALVALLKAEAAAATPATLVPSIVAVACGAASGAAGAAGGTALSLAEGTLKTLAVGRIKTAILIAAVAAGTALPVAGIASRFRRAGGKGAFSGFRETVVWKSGHRNPAIVVTPRGTLLAFAEQRRQVAAGGNTDLVARRSTDGGTSWGEPTIVHDAGRNRIGSPCPIVDGPDGDVLLLITRNTGKLLVTRSADDGLTWAAPRPIEVVQGAGRPAVAGSGHGIRHSSGRLLAPAHAQQAFCLYSDDRGRTWRRGADIGHRSGQSTLVETAGEEIYINCRSGGAGRRAVARSSDRGRSWSGARLDPELAEPTGSQGCQASLVRLTGARRHGRSRVLYSGPAHPRDRKDLAIRISYDECRTWKACKVIKKGNASFSDLVVLPDTSIGCLYETNDGGWQQIRFARFTLEWLTGGKDKLDRDAFKTAKRN
jgi:sialidase-1